MKFFLTLLLIICISDLSYSMAFPPFPSGGPAGSAPDCWPPPCIPIDGGISLLIAAGAIYGGRKLYKNHQEKNSL